MRRVYSTSLIGASRHAATRRPLVGICFAWRASFGAFNRTLANVREGGKALPEVWFTSTNPRQQTDEWAGENGKPPDERTLKLGKTLRILQERLPTLLSSPLPQEILSPHITLHLFPSTHPHLPTVSGRVAYSAALWTAPMAWGRVPIVGNIRLEILSERMVKNGAPSIHTAGGQTSSAKYPSERLIVRWKTCGKTKGKGMGALYRGISGSEQVDKITEFLGGDVRDDEEFCGLFIFEFDEEGRILNHIIEHAEEGNNWDKTPRVISLTDWLLKKAKGNKDDETDGLALGYCELDNRAYQRRHGKRRNGSC